MATRKAEGRSTRPPPNSKYAHHPQNLEVSSEATLADCYVDDRVQFAADGSVINDEVATVDATATLERIGTDWKVSEVQVHERGSGDLGCAG
jgi:hypothetical protein